MTSPSREIEQLYERLDKRSGKTLFSVLKSQLERELRHAYPSVEVWDQYIGNWVRRGIGSLYPCNPPTPQEHIRWFNDSDPPHDTGKLLDVDNFGNVSTGEPTPWGYTQSDRSQHRTRGSDYTVRGTYEQPLYTCIDASRSENNQDFMRSLENQSDNLLEGTAEARASIEKIKNKGLFHRKKRQSNKKS